MLHALHVISVCNIILTSKEIQVKCSRTSVGSGKCSDEGYFTEDVGHWQTSFRFWYEIKFLQIYVRDYF